MSHNRALLMRGPASETRPRAYALHALAAFFFSLACMTLHLSLHIYTGTPCTSHSSTWLRRAAGSSSKSSAGQARATQGSATASRNASSSSRRSIPASDTGLDRALAQAREALNHTARLAGSGRELGCRSHDGRVIARVLLRYVAPRKPHMICETRQCGL